MKNLLCILLSALLLLGLCACGGAAPGDTAATTAAEGNTSLQAGFAQVDITPTESVPLSGYGNAEQRYSTGMLDYLYATCIYLVDGQGTAIVLVAMDLGNLYDPLPTYREDLAETFGLSEEQVMFCCSHTHSGPYLSFQSDPAISSYNTSLLKKLEKVIQKAKADIKPVTGMYHTITETEGLNFVRRYIMNDGTYCGDNYGDSSSGFASHESEGDSTLQLLKFTRDGGKDIILTNFQTHPHRTGGAQKYDISADIVGIYRTELESQLDCYALYFTGSSGNVNPTSRIKTENVYSDYKEHGKAMAQYAVEASASFVPVDMGSIQISKTVYTGTCNHTDDHLLSYAREVQARMDSGMSNADALSGYEQYGIQNAFHASAIISHAALPKTMDVPLYTISVGDFAMAFAPFELFAELGVTIKDGSPFGATFVCCYANNGFSYLPTTLGFDHGGYGPYKSNFVSGTGEIIANIFIEELEALHNTK